MKSNEYLTNADAKITTNLKKYFT